MQLTVMIQGRVERKEGGVGEGEMGRGETGRERQGCRNGEGDRDA